MEQCNGCKKEDFDNAFYSIGEKMITMQQMIKQQEMNTQAEIDNNGQVRAKPMMLQKQPRSTKNTPCKTTKSKEES